MNRKIVTTSAVLATVTWGLAIYLFDFKFEKLIDVDWQAVGSIIAAVGLVIAAWAARASADAAKAAVEIDRAQFDRAERARLKRAAAMAVGIDHELTIVAAKAKFLARRAAAFAQMPRELPLPGIFSETEKAALSLFERVQDMHTPLLERFVDSVGDFDDSSAAQLIKALSALYQMKATHAHMSSPKPEHLHRQLRLFAKGARTLRRECVLGRRRISAHRRRSVRLRKSSPSAH